MLHAVFLVGVCDVGVYCRQRERVDVTFLFVASFYSHR